VVAQGADDPGGSLTAEQSEDQLGPWYPLGTVTWARSPNIVAFGEDTMMYLRAKETGNGSVHGG
jgi:hypothetical protein